jgi:hypothetical protein
VRLTALKAPIASSIGSPARLISRSRAVDVLMINADLEELETFVCGYIYCDVYIYCYAVQLRMVDLVMRT